MQADQDRSGVIDFQEFVALFIALTKKSALGVQEAKTILLQRCAPCGCAIPDMCRIPWPTHACIATTNLSAGNSQSQPVTFSVHHALLACSTAATSKLLTHPPIFPPVPEGLSTGRPTSSRSVLRSPRGCPPACCCPCRPVDRTPNQLKRLSTYLISTQPFFMQLQPAVVYDVSPTTCCSAARQAAVLLDIVCTAWAAAVSSCEPVSPARVMLACTAACCCYTGACYMQ